MIMKKVFNINMERSQSVTIWEDGCLSTEAQNGDNPQVDLNEDQTRNVYEELHKIYGEKDT
jgi:hypothetical protein